MELGMIVRVVKVMLNKRKRALTTILCIRSYYTKPGTKPLYGLQPCAFTEKINCIWYKVFKNEPSKICRRQTFKKFQGVWFVLGRPYIPL